MRSGLTRLLAAAAAAAFAGVSLGTAASASPRYLYYVNGETIMRVAVTGGAPQRVVSAGGDSVTGMAAAQGRLFWASEAGTSGAIRYTGLTGGTPRTLVTGLSFPVGLVYADGWLYYADQNAIGRVRPDGSGLNRRFIRLAAENGGTVAEGLATDGSYLYFSRCQDDEIGRAGLNGGGLNLTFIKLPRQSCPQELAVGDGHIYWAELSGHIGRATLTGKGASVTWLNIREQAGPFNVAADSTSVYWDWGGTAGSPEYIGTASANGTGLRTKYLTGQGAFLLT